MVNVIHIVFLYSVIDLQFIQSLWKCSKM